MRIRTVLIWFIVAGLLAAIVAATRSSTPGQAKPTQAEPWAIPLDPARVDALKLVIAGDDAFRVDRVAAGVDRWALGWRGDETGGAAPWGSWAADPERVRAAIRLLGSARVTPSGEGAEAVQPAATVQIIESDGRSIDIGFGARASGGQIPVVVDVRDAQNIAERRVVGRLPADTYDAFVRTPWTAWRHTALFDAVTANARTISIEAGPNRVQLQRGSRGWAITQPYPLEADSDEVERTLGAIASLQADHFVQTPPSDDATGLDAPLATITVQTETGARRLTLGRGTDGAGATIFARIHTDTADQIVHVSRESVAQLTAVPEAYARRTPLGISGADIARVRFMATTGRTRFEARRSAGDWTVDGVPASPDQRDAINRLIAVMTLEPASRVASVTTDAQSAALGAPLGEIQFLTDEGLPLAALKLSMGDELRLSVSQTVADGRSLVWTSVSEKAKGVALWASAMASHTRP